MKLLLLAGTGDARRIAEGLAGMEGVSALASLAGATRRPADLAIKTRHGGFSALGGLGPFLQAKGFQGVLDATHPFASIMSHEAATTARSLGLAHLQMLRPGWQQRPEDNWTWIRDEAGAAAHIPAGARVFVATGRKTLERYANLADAEVICRRIDPAQSPFPLARGRYLISRPPFSVEDEIALFRKLEIDFLVVKNSGGAASFTKLEAARALEVPVLMIQRPVQPVCNRVETVAEALSWVRGLMT